jgi:hypothetical protein
MPPSPRMNYLNNRDLLAAINESKLTYCEFTDPVYRNYDIIVYSLDTVTPDVIEAARIKKLNDMQLQEKKASGSKTFESKLTLSDVPAERIVVRLMTFDHIPLNPNKPNAKTKAEQHIRCPFPPFQHYVFQNNTWQCVGKSHYKNGEFSITHGRITNQLGHMWLKLVERFGHRGNWRGYCCDTETQALTHRGFLSYDEITLDDKIVSYHRGNLVWSEIKSIYIGDYNGKMFHLTAPGMDALVTPHHKFLTERGLVEVENLDKDDTLILLGNELRDKSVFAEDINKTGDFGQIETVVHGKMLRGASRKISVKGIDFHGGYCDFGDNVPVVDYTGTVWCPKTEYGCFVARRNGEIYISGNTYLDEMRAQALVQLSQVGLQFDESKSSNPFAYYSSVASTSFLKILTSEKKNQTIRDDLLTMHGATPSMTRQIEDQLAQQDEQILPVNHILGGPTGPQSQMA